MKLAGLSVGSYSAVIIDPVGGVGVLLNLRNQNSFANGVQSSRRNEKHISLMNRYLIENLQQGVVLNPFLKLRLTDLFLKAIVQISAWLAVYDIPHLGFSIFTFHPQSKFIIWVNLNRKVVLSVDQLDQNRKILKSFAMCPQNSFSVLFKVLG